MKLLPLATHLTLTCLLLLPGIGLSDDPGTLRPSEAMTLMVNAAMNNPEASRKYVYEDYLPRVMRTDLSQDEQFFLGEVYFFALMPEQARDAFYPLLDDGSMRARVSWQRLLQIRFRAFQMYDRAARDMIAFRENFPAIPEDREYLSRQVQNFGKYHAERGEHGKVVTVVEAELAALNYDGAYDSFIHPATFIESYVALGKKKQALKHLKSAQNGLLETLELREQSEPETDYIYPLPAERYAFLYTPMVEKLGWHQHNEKFRKLISRLEDAVAQIESL